MNITTGFSRVVATGRAQQVTPFPPCIGNVATGFYGHAFRKHGTAMTQAVQSDRRRGRAASRKYNVIQIRASVETKAILNGAATLRGQKLSEFMLESARRQAEETILDQRTFFLDSAAHAKFLAPLDVPAKPTGALRAFIKRKPSWER